MEAVTILVVVLVAVLIICAFWIGWFLAVERLFTVLVDRSGSDSEYKWRQRVERAAFPWRRRES